MMEFNAANDVSNIVPAKNIDELKNKLILVVDDMEFNLLIIKEIYNSRGFNNVITANSGKDALEKAESLKPELIILDLVMPEVDGFEFLKRYRSKKGSELTPVIVQTVMNVSEQKTRAFSLGATDFVTKPIDKDEIIARSITHLERQKLYDDLYKTNLRIESELQDAKQLQDSIMPQELEVNKLESHYGFQVKSHFEPSSEIGGDYWGFSEISPEKFCIFSVDFSGHGVRAAMNIFRLHALMRDNPPTMDTDPALYLEKLNKSMMNLLPIGQFATMFYGIVDVGANNLKYATAGCPNPFYINQSENKLLEIDGSGFPIGSFKGATYKTRELPFNSKSMIVLYSDALIETEDKTGHFLKNTDIHAIITKIWNDNNKSNIAGNCFDEIMKIFNENYKARVADDFTFNIYYRN